MTSLVAVFDTPMMCSRAIEVPDYNSFMAGMTTSIERLPAESIGTFALTLNNVVVGSAINIETQSGSVIEHRIATAASEVFQVPAYPSGTPANSLRIKVRKGSSAPFFQPYETQAVAAIGSQSVFVSQIPD